MTVDRALIATAVCFAVSVSLWFAPVGVPPAVALAAAAAAPAEEGVPSQPLPSLPEVPDPADAVDRLPDRVVDLPDDASAVVDPASGWTAVPGTPIQVRDDADAPPATPPAADSTGQLVVVPAVATVEESVDSAPVEVSVEQPADPAEAAFLIEVAAAPAAPVEPSPSASPSESPSASPSAEPSPSTDPSASPSPSGDPSASPSTTVPAADSPVELKVNHLPTGQALDKAEQFLGGGYTQAGPGRYLSQDGLRQVRMTDADIAPRGGQLPHLNFETWASAVSSGGRNKLLENLHIYLPEEFP